MIAFIKITKNPILYKYYLNFKIINISLIQNKLNFNIQKHISMDKENKKNSKEKEVKVLTAKVNNNI